jgi:hypothetical protein
LNGIFVKASRMINGYEAEKGGGKASRNGKFIDFEL